MGAHCAGSTFRNMFADYIGDNPRDSALVVDDFPFGRKIASASYPLKCLLWMPNPLTLCLNDAPLLAYVQNTQVGFKK
ncbi:hypothetical protein SOASR030_37680 [Leminorella grimontii]|uniref:Uncharacterized protein n=1 Tax=Leminorella grimontii TaxID=82981 RepID=A0AAV5N6B1_9GAMM|nr:hypothetical protein SOASR030_37680 [Leminorella grimontii]GKX61342.1 hypothetical protein SOASR031_36570 [Leminorella grimontii]